MKAQFYITLPSNSSMKIFPENKTCCYITQLPRTIELHGEWEVAIVEIQYPLTYLPSTPAEPDLADPRELQKLQNPVMPPHVIQLTRPEREVLPAGENRGTSSLMFVYCDIIEPRIVGDVYAPLLRIVQARQTSNGSTIEAKTFSPPHYLPLLLSSFRTIEISIKDDQGRSIPFEHGTLTVTLHFKKLY